MPAIHSRDAANSSTCKGFTLAISWGARRSDSDGSRKDDPEPMAGCFAVRAAGGMASARGSRLNRLSKENGQMSLTATSPQSAAVIHRGAFFSGRRKATTAKNHPAGRHTPVQKGEEYRFHQASSSYSATRRRSWATSSGVRALRAVNAARKAGREPSKVSSTNFSLCRA